MSSPAMVFIHALALLKFISIMKQCAKIFPITQDFAIDRLSVVKNLSCQKTLEIIDQPCLVPLPVLITKLLTESCIS